MLAFFDVALALDRAEQAAPALAALIHRAACGDKGFATDCWITLVRAVPGQVIDAPTLARLLPELEARMERAPDRPARQAARADLVGALQRCVEPSTPGLTPGLALHLFELARDRDAESARRAARVALDSRELHEAKRERIERQLAEIEREAAEAAQEADAADATTELRVTDAVPIELAEQGLLLEEVSSGRRSRLDYRAIEALAVGSVSGLAAAPVLLVDLVLRESRRRPELRAVVRMRGDTFDPRSLVGNEAEPEEARRLLLAELLERSRAVPLPDPDGALGLPPRDFASLREHERELLQHLG